MPRPLRGVAPVYGAGLKFSRRDLLLCVKSKTASYRYRKEKLSSMGVRKKNYFLSVQERKNQRVGMKKKDSLVTARGKYKCGKESRGVKVTRFAGAKWAYFFFSVLW